MDGFDPAAVFAELLSQAAEVDIDRAIQHVGVLSPGGHEELVSREYLVGSARKAVKKLELGCPISNTAKKTHFRLAA